MMVNIKYPYIYIYIYLPYLIIYHMTFMMISDGKLHHSTGVRSAPISTPGLCWAIEVREFPAGQSHVGGTEGHRFYRGKKPKKKRLETACCKDSSVQGLVSVYSFLTAFFSSNFPKRRPLRLSLRP